MKNYLMAASIIFLILVFGACDSAFGPVELEKNQFIRIYNWNPENWSNDLFYDGIITADGGLIFVARIESPDAGGYDIWVVKTNPTGIIEWQTVIDLCYGDYGWQIIQSPEGDYYICGVNYALESVGAVYKINSSGEFIWQRMTWRTGEDSRFSAMIQKENGTIILAGRINGEIGLISFDGDFGNINKYGSGYAHDLMRTSDGGYVIIGSASDWDERVVIRTDSSFNELWRRSFNFTINGLQEYNDGILLFGYSGNNFIVCQTDYFGENPVELRISPEPGFYPHNASLAVANDGNFIIADKLKGPADSTGYQPDRAALIKINPAGDILWEQFLPVGGEWSSCYDIINSADGGYTVFGWCRFSDSTAVDVFIAKTDENGLID